MLKKLFRQSALAFSQLGLSAPTKQSFKTIWQKRYQEERDAYRQLLQKDVFADWARNSNPEWTAERQLFLALKVFYSGLNDSEGHSFLSKADCVIKRTLQERKLESEACRNGFPLNRGRLLRTQAYVSAILSDDFSLDAELLKQAASDHLEWGRPYKGRDWDSQAQAYYLAAIRLCLLAEDFSGAENLLSTTRSFRWHEDEFRLWVKYVEERTHTASFSKVYEDFFLKVRNPDYVPDIFLEKNILQLELGIIGHKNRSAQASQSQKAWPQIIESISA